MLNIIRYFVSLINIILLIFGVLLPTMPISNKAVFISDTSTPSEVFPPESGGPNEYLSCPIYDDIPIGPSWHSITIGVSQLNELAREMGDSQKNSIRVLHEWPGGVTSLNYRGKLVCVQDGIIVAMTISEPFFRNLSDYVAVYGIPDAVTWTPRFNSRIVFWFKQGIAVEAWTGTLNKNDLYWGNISYVIYFPYQEVEGYKTRWPYNATWPEAPNLLGIGDPVPTEQNPFNFEAMIATITAEPSRTPTPTFAPAESQLEVLTATPLTSPTTSP